MFEFFGLGKQRTKFGRFLDRNSISQIEVSKKSKLSNSTLSKMSGNKDYRPKYSTITRVIKALKDMGYRVEGRDFWDI